MNIRSSYPPSRMNQVSFNGNKAAVAATVYEKIAQKIAEVAPDKAINCIKERVAPSSDKVAGLLNHLQTWNGIYVGILYVINTQRNKDIPNERKPALHINNMFTSILALVISAACYGKVTKAAERFGDKYFTAEKIEKMAAKLNFDKNICNEKFFNKGIKFAATTALVTGVFRFAVPVIAGPVAQQLVKFSADRGWIKDPKHVKKQPLNHQSENKSVNVLPVKTEKVSKPTVK